MICKSEIIIKNDHNNYNNSYNIDHNKIFNNDNNDMHNLCNNNVIDINYNDDDNSNSQYINIAYINKMITGPVGSPS